MSSILLLENIHHSAVGRLAEARIEIDRRADAPNSAELCSALQAHDLVGIRSATRLGRPEINAAPHLLAIGCFCIGTSQVDLDAAAAAGIPVFNAPFSNTRSVAELVIAEAVLLIRRVPEKNALAHIGIWAKGAGGSFEARGKTIAIIGYGNIGSQVGVLAEAMGMRIIYYDIHAKLALGSARASHSLLDAVSVADIVTLHVPQTAQTRLLINAEVLARFKAGACLINASRGSVVDIDALAHALNERRLGGAAIDVFPDEPKNNTEAFESVLRKHLNVILTPHIGGSTEEAQENIGVEVASKVISFLGTGDTAGAVNFPHVTPGLLCAPARLVNVHRNVPGALAALNTHLAASGSNIVAQHLQTQGATGYVVTDLEQVPSRALIELLAVEPGFVRSRLLVRPSE